jgi:hypothetical protein
VLVLSLERAEVKLFGVVYLSISYLVRVVISGSKREIRIFYMHSQLALRSTKLRERRISEPVFFNIFCSEKRPSARSLRDAPRRW